MQVEHDEIGYRYRNSRLNPSHKCLLPKVKAILAAEGIIGRKTATRIFDIGCGNGSVANELNSLGLEVIGVDPSVEGVRWANQAYPHLRIERRSAYDDLAAEYGTYDVVLSLEVLCHLCAPRKFAETTFKLTNDDGIAVISVPYHGYWKNLLLAITGQLNAHFRPLWDNGYVKFWSVKTLRTLLLEAGFKSVQFVYAGRVWPLSKSMIAIARKM